MGSKIVDSGRVGASSLLQGLFEDWCLPRCNQRFFPLINMQYSVDLNVALLISGIVSSLVKWTFFPLDQEIGSCLYLSYASVFSLSASLQVSHPSV